MQCTRYDSGITFIMYAQSQKIIKLYNLNLIIRCVHFNNKYILLNIPVSCSINRRSNDYRLEKKYVQKSKLPHLTTLQEPQSSHPEFWWRPFCSSFQFSVMCLFCLSSFCDFPFLIAPSVLEYPNTSFVLMGGSAIVGFSSDCRIR